MDKNVVICVMNILVIAATEAEIAPSIKHIGEGWQESENGFWESGGVYVRFAVTGVGAIATAYQLTGLLAKGKYDLVIQAGIAGTFDRGISLGEVVNVTSDCVADLGAEDGKEFIDVFDLGLADANGLPFKNKVLPNPGNKYDPELKKVGGITINTVTGSEETAAILYKRYQCETESMEGAAMHYVCLAEDVDFLQVRGISNYIERRNRESWEIGLAVKNLNSWLIRFINALIE